MSTTRDILPLEVVQTKTGGPPFVMRVPEAASQTFKVGAIINQNSSGYFLEATSVATAALTRIAGVALEPGHNDSTAGNKNVLIAVADENSIFVASLDTGQVTSLLDVGRAYQIEKDSTTSNWVVNKSLGPAATANRAVIVLALDDRDDVGDACGRVRFVFHPASRALAYAS